MRGLHAPGRLGILSRGVVAPVLFLLYFVVYAVAAHQLHRAGFMRLWHPRIWPFLFLFLICISDLRPRPPGAPVVMAFGHALPFCGFSITGALPIVQHFVPASRILGTPHTREHSLERK
jgi:hypothetical protein